MLESRSEMYQAGWNDFVAGNDCMFGNNLEYMEGWTDCEEMAWELEVEAQAERYADQHMYFEA